MKLNQSSIPPASMMTPKGETWHLFWTHDVSRIFEAISHQFMKFQSNNKKTQKAFFNQLFIYHQLVGYCQNYAVPAVVPPLITDCIIRTHTIHFKVR